jgi:hypothetical protein
VHAVVVHAVVVHAVVVHAGERQRGARWGCGVVKEGFTRGLMCRDQYVLGGACVAVG